MFSTISLFLPLLKWNVLGSRGEGKVERWKDGGWFRLLSGLQVQDICHTNWLVWLVGAHLSAPLVSDWKFMFPQVSSSISGYGVIGPRLSGATVISYFKTRHSHNISNLSPLHFFCICTVYLAQLWGKPSNFFFLFIVFFFGETLDKMKHVLSSCT